MRMLAMLALFVNASFAMAFDVKKPSFALEPFELKWMNHEDPTTLYRSNDYPQAVFVIEAYFKNCPYCNDNAPMVDRLRAQYADNPNIQIVDVGRDCRGSDYTAWIDRHHPNHPVLNDCDMSVLGKLGVQAYPSTFILDCNLNVKKKHTGSWSNATYNTVVAEIDAVVAAGCTKTE